MDTNIGADAAKLAGLQIDLLQKMRKGHVTWKHLKWFVDLTKSERDALAVEKPIVKQLAQKPEKFALLADLGIITVPDGYDHSNQLAVFRKRNDANLVHDNAYIIDANFPNPTRVLRAGDKLRVCAYRQTVSFTTAEEQIDFLRSQKAVLTGAQGLSLVLEQKRDQLPKNMSFASLDEKERLLRDTDVYWVPFAAVDCVIGDPLNVGLRFGLREFDEGWYYDHAILCFCEVSDAITPTPTKWTVDDEDNIHFTLTSNGFTREQWERHLESRGFRISDEARKVLRCVSTAPTNGVAHHIVVRPGSKIVSRDRVMKKIRAYAAYKGWMTPHWEVAFLIRDTFPNGELKKMGLFWIVTMHEPIIDSRGDPRLFYSLDDGPRLHTYYGGSDDGCDDGGGVAFSDPQVSSQT